MLSHPRTFGLWCRLRSRRHDVLFALVASLLATVACLILAAPATLAAPGTQLWVSRYDANGNEFPSAVAVSPGGSKVFVTGSRRPSVGSPGLSDYATVAYDASTGGALWAKRYNAANREDSANALAVSPDGTKVFVTGSSVGSTSGYDYATIAYDASSGAQLWVKRYNGAANRTEISEALTVSLDGTKVFVTGSSDGSTSGPDYATVAYDASNGTQLWVRRYDGPANGDDYSRDVGVASNGSKVFVTGYSDGLASSTSPDDYATVSYDATSGTQLWVKRYDGPAHRDDRAFALAANPRGARVFVTGRSYGSSTTGYDYTTVAYNSSTGMPVWVKRYDGPASVPGGDTANALGVSPDGSGLFVTGYSWASTTSSFDYATLAYNTANGATLWTRRYAGPTNSDDFATAIGVASDGSRLFVTGGSPGSTTSGQDFATLAYSIP